MRGRLTGSKTAGLLTILASYALVVLDIYLTDGSYGDTLTPGFDAENLLKPDETVRISAAIKPKAAAPCASQPFEDSSTGRNSVPRL